MKYYSWKFEWLTSWEEIFDHDFVDQWQTWIDNADYAHVFFESSLVLAWVETYKKLKNIQPRFLIARNSDNCLIFLPLVQVKENWKGAFQTSLLPVGYSEFDYHDPIVVGSSDISVTKSFWGAFSEELLNRWEGDFDVAVVNGLRLTARSDDLKAMPCDSAPFIDLTIYGSIHEFMKGRGQSLRGDINRQMGRLEGLGKTELRVYSNEETNAALISLSTMLEEHKRKWPRSYKASSFHENLVRRSLPARVLHFSEILLNGATISWHFGYLHKSRYYWYMPVYRPEFQQYSPGKIHLYMSIKEALSKGVTIFDLLKGDEDYKRQWTKESVPLFNFKCTSKSWISSMRIFLFDTIKPAISKVVRSLKK